jgi:hypothetical protein
VEEFTESAAEGIGMKGARGGEFGGWFQNGRHDHGHGQIEFVAGMLVEEAVELQIVACAEDGGNVAMRTGADDVKGKGKRSTDGSSAFEDGAESLDLSGGPMREVGEGAVVDLAVAAEGLAEEDSGRGAAIWGP